MRKKLVYKYTEIGCSLIRKRGLKFQKKLVC